MAMKVTIEELDAAIVKANSAVFAGILNALVSRDIVSIEEVNREILEPIQQSYQRVPGAATDAKSRADFLEAQFGLALLDKIRVRTGGESA